MAQTDVTLCQPINISTLEEGHHHQEHAVQR